MSTWNYRVIEFVAPDGEEWRAIHEVHTDDDGGLIGYGEEPAPVMGSAGDGDMRGSMEWTLDRMREALDKPILIERDFQKASDSGGER